MGRVFENGQHLALLHDLPLVHHDYSVGYLGDDAEIVRDEDDAYAQVVAQVAQQTEYASLHRHVQGGGWFVGEKNVRVGDQGHRDHGALAHAAGKLMRVGTGSFFGVADTHFLHHLDGPLLGFLLCNIFMDENGLGHLIEDGQVGVEATHGVLEDHGNSFSAYGPE